MTTTTKPETTTTGNRVNEYAAQTQVIRFLEADLKRRKEELRRQEDQILETFAHDGIQNMKTASGQTVYLNREVFARLVGDTKKAHTALRRAGLGDFIKSTVNAQTLRAYVREKEESEEELPKGLQPYIDVAEVYRLRVRS